MYELESAGLDAQQRYVALIHRLDQGKVDRNRHLRLPASQIIRRENQTLCQSQILQMFEGSAPIGTGAIHEHLRMLGHSRSTTKNALRALTNTGLLTSLKTKYRLLSDEQSMPLEIGVPIMFLPGLKSQEPGVIIDKKELKHAGGGVYPIARLRSGRMVFVNPEMAKADMSQINFEEHERWLQELIRDSAETGIGRSQIAWKAYQEKIPEITKLIQYLEKSGVIKGRLQNFKGERMKVFWTVEYFPCQRR